MQLFLEGTNTLYWKQISELADGVYNKDNTQTSSANIPQLFAAFIDRAAGTEVDIYMSVNNGNFIKMAAAKVADETGFVYARFTIPYSRALDYIEITIKEHGPFFTIQDKTIASEMFSSSHIAYMFEVQAKAAEQTLIDAAQQEQNSTIEGVEDGLLGNKFGAYTGLDRRADQPVNTYRSQTACLWKAFQYAGTEQGITDAIRCVIGDYDGTQTILTTTTTKVSGPNLVYEVVQFGPTGDGFITDQVPPLSRSDVDTPHYYVPDLGPTGDGFFTDLDTLPTLETLGPFDGAETGEAYDSDTVKQFMVNTTAAIGNEVIVEITSQISLGIPEEAALANVDGEQVLRRNPAPTLSETGEDNPDYTANQYIATDITVTKCTIGGIETVALTDLPTEGTDFVVTKLTGKIVWSDVSLKVPDTGTIYTVSYKFRLDRELKIVLGKIKPIHKKVVIIFSKMSSGLPRSLEA